MDNMEFFVQVVVCIIGIITTGAVPWAYLMERRLASIEGKLLNGIQDRLQRLEARADSATERLRVAEATNVQLLTKLDLNPPPTSPPHQ